MYNIKILGLMFQTGSEVNIGKTGATCKTRNGCDFDADEVRR